MKNYFIKNYVNNPYLFYNNNKYDVKVNLYQERILKLLYKIFIKD